MRRPDGVYNLRYSVNGKRVWESLKTTDPTLAVQRLRAKLTQLESSPAPVEPEQDTVTASSEILPAPHEDSPDERSLCDLVAEYLDETKAHKSSRTLAAYRVTLERFQESCKKKFLRDITRKDVIAFMGFLKARGNAPRTVSNRVDYLHIFFHRYRVDTLLLGSDKPRFTEKKVRSYSTFDLGKMFGWADQNENDLLQFFLCTGAREQEVQFACWSDLDLEAKTFTVTEKLDLGFRPKDKEEGSIPIPESLVEVLKRRRVRYPKGRLIFPTDQGKPDGHLLRTIKTLALKAGVNCGHCTNKAGLSCARHPVCKHVGLHRLRKTFATLHHRNGLPARKLMRWLRHSDLDTTLKYIADEDDEQTRGIVESTFSKITGGAQ